MNTPKTTYTLKDCLSDDNLIIRMAKEAREAVCSKGLTCWPRSRAKNLLDRTLDRLHASLIVFHPSGLGHTPFLMCKLTQKLYFCLPSSLSEPEQNIALARLVGRHLLQPEGSKREGEIISLRPEDPLSARTTLFASHFLMPDDLLKEKLQKTSDPSALASRFGVPRAYVAARLYAIKHEPQKALG